MFPTLKDGDIIFFKNYEKENSILIVGQIVIFNHPLKKIRLIKRIKFIKNNSIELFGENIEFSDDSRKFGLVNDEYIIGIVTSKLFKFQFINFLSKKIRSTFLKPK